MSGILLAVVLAVQDPSLEELIKRLGAESLTDRENASRQIEAVGRPALPELRKAAQLANPEISGRARDVIREILSTLPRLTDRKSIDLPLGGPYNLTASPRATWIAVTDGKLLQVREAKTLKLVASLFARGENLGFDAEDRVLTVVGPSLVRFDTTTWKPIFKADLPDSDCFLSGQAFVRSDGSVWYRTKERRVARVEVQGGALRRRDVLISKAQPNAWVRRILDVPIAGGPLIVQIDPRAEIFVSSDGTGTPLVGAFDPVFGGILEDGTVIVSKQKVSIYDTSHRLVKVIKRSMEVAGGILPADQRYDTFAVAVDPVRATLFTSEPSAFRARCLLKPEKTYAWNLPMGPFYRATIDEEGRYLSVLSAVKLYRWKLED